VHRPATASHVNTLQATPGPASGLPVDDRTVTVLDDIGAVVGQVVRLPGILVEVVEFVVAAPAVPAPGSSRAWYSTTARLFVTGDSRRPEAVRRRRARWRTETVWIPTARTAPMTDETGSGIEVETVSGEQRIDVRVDGDPFTSYQYADSVPVLAKPVLHPIHAASGAVVTRGYPLDPRPGERVDHDHHIGHSFTYGVEPGVNGVDFWGVSDTIDPEEADDRGRIHHRETRRAEGGEGTGVLEVELAWVRGDGERILTEETEFRFGATQGRRTVDRISTLTATDGPVSMPDDKEGMFAVRVAPGLEHPEEGRIEVVAEDGGTTEIDGAEGRSGEYLSSEGTRGLDVWGARAEWMRLAGTVEDEAVAVTIMDHPENPGHPTHWHARGYGLFAANPLGREIFTDGEASMGFALGDGESTTFRYRIAVDNGVPTAEELHERHAAFVDAV